MMFDGSRRRPTEAAKKVDAYLDFRADLRDVLGSGDVQVFRAFLRDAGESFSDPELGAVARWNDATLLPLLHRMTIADPRLKPHHAASRAWLRARGIAPRVKATGYGWSTDLRRHYEWSKTPTSRQHTA